MISMHPEVKAFLDKRHQHIVGGKHVNAVDGATFETLNPANGEVLAVVAEGSASDIDHAVDAATRGFQVWSSLMPSKRERLMHQFADKIEAKREILAQLETLDNGKPYNKALNVETNVALGQLRYFAGWPTKLTGEIYAVSSPGFHAFSEREPLGVCGAITPWNYSIVMAMQKIAPALAAGNSVVLKPAEQTPLTALYLSQLALDAGLPDGVLNTVTGRGATAGAALVRHPGVAKIGFTGSTEVGKSILTAASADIKRVSLELGGKSPLIVFPDTDIESAVQAAFWGLFGNSGQNCVAASRLYLHDSIADEFEDALVKVARLVKVGPGLGKDTELGPLISDQQMNRVLDFIEQGQNDGAKLLTGGSRIGGELSDGYFMSPTIFSGVSEQHEIGCEEIFGPVMTVFRFSTEAEVVSRANNSPYRLAAGVWTDDLSRAHRMIKNLRAGVVWVNTYDWFDPAVPFGGNGQSGLGRELGRQAMEMYTELKSTWIKIDDGTRVAQ